MLWITSFGAGYPQIVGSCTPDRSQVFHILKPLLAQTAGQPVRVCPAVQNDSESRLLLDPRGEFLDFSAGRFLNRLFLFNFVVAMLDRRVVPVA